EAALAAAAASALGAPLAAAAGSGGGAVLSIGFGASVGFAVAVGMSFLAFDPDVGLDVATTTRATTAASARPAAATMSGVLLFGVVPGDVGDAKIACVPPCDAWPGLDAPGARSAAAKTEGACTKGGICGPVALGGGGGA